MGLWSVLTRLWRWLRDGSGFGVEELARRLGCDATDLEAFQPGYREFTVPKRSGGLRKLCAPDERLKELQRKVLRRLLGRLKVHAAATGFQRGQSIVTHARQHTGQAVVVRLDIKDFFPSTAARRVYRYFRKIGWNRPAARLLKRLCTHQDGLPQGAPTSPRLSNLVNYHLDCRLTAIARKLGAHYSRYADDITLSFPTDDRRQIRYLIRFVRRVAAETGYLLHGAKKLRIRRQHQQQRVTGLVVNECVNLPREVRRRLRAVEHHLRTGRPATLTPQQLAGWRAFQHMVATQTVGPPHAQEVCQERERLHGTWVVIAAERHGKPVSAEQFASDLAGLKWIIEADRVILERGDKRVEARYRLGTGKEPRTIDLTPTCGPGCGKRMRGIYDLQSELLKICLNHGKGPRPSNFSVDADSQATLLFLKRDGLLTSPVCQS